MRYTPSRGALVKILSWPRPYEDNPYLARLTEALARVGVESRSHRYLAALAARPGGARWLHLHWPEWMTRDRSRSRSAARAAWLLALLDALRARGVRLAWTAHNLVGHDDPHPDLAWAQRRALLERCSLVHGHFASAERSVRALGFAGRFVLAAHPHAGDDYQPSDARGALRRRMGFSDDARVLLCFGAIERYKGFDRVAEAFVRGARQADRLVIAGRVASDEALRALLRASEGDARVTVRPWFHDRAESADVVRAADAMVLGYRAFFTSGTAMLALSLGTPVVGPPEHHLSTLVGEPFFAAMPEPSALWSALDALDAQARAQGRDGIAQVRARAEQWARQWTYDGLARTLADAFARDARP